VTREPPLYPTVRLKSAQLASFAETQGISFLNKQIKLSPKIEPKFSHHSRAFSKERPRILDLKHVPATSNPPTNNKSFRDDRSPREETSGINQEGKPFKSFIDSYVTEKKRRQLSKPPTSSDSQLSIDSAPNNHHVPNSGFQSAAVASHKKSVEPRVPRVLRIFKNLDEPAAQEQRHTGLLQPFGNVKTKLQYFNESSHKT